MRLTKMAPPSNVFGPPTFSIPQESTPLVAKPPPYPQTNCAMIEPDRSLRTVHEPTSRKGHVSQRHVVHFYQEFPPDDVTMELIQMHEAPPAVVNFVLPTHSTWLTCPSCHLFTETRVERRISLWTHLVAILLCFTCCWPFCLFPYCMESCQAARHYCTICDAFVGDGYD